MNDYLSRSPEFDRPEYYRFERNSGLPYGAFGRSRRNPTRWIADGIASLIAHPNAVVLLICAVAGIVTALLP